jgi:hypothetical protein
MYPVMRQSLVLATIVLAACRSGDWKQAAAADGMEQIRADIGDASARFSDVQVVGDSRTGQICGKVLAHDVSTGFGTPARFVVYIDHTSGPWIEGQHGRETVTDSRFDFAWQHDCVDEGWRQP